MIGALIACILVLGFNYWVASSRNLELQTKLYELEGQVRRGAAERGVAELKKSEFQEEIQRQKEQIARIENLYKRQLEDAQNACSKDKGSMQLNVSSSTKAIDGLKGQLNQLNDELWKLQKQLKGCQGNLNTLNKKLTYDMTQCNTQILSQKELCDERVAAAKVDFQKRIEKLALPPASFPVNAAPTVKDKPAKQAEAANAALDETKNIPVLNLTPDLSRPDAHDPLRTNEVVLDKALDPLGVLPSEKVLPQPVSESTPPAAEEKQDASPPPEGAVTAQEGEDTASKLPAKRSTEDKGRVEVMDVHNEDAQIEEADPGVEDMLIGRGKADETPAGHKEDEPDDYDGDEQIVGEADLEKGENQQKENLDKDMEDELADYNGDDDNEGEFEADKQAALAQT